MIPAEETATDTKKLCIKCEALIDLNGKFCNSCGTKQTHAAEVESRQRWALLKQASLFYAIIIIIAAASNFIDAFDTLPWLLTFEVALIITTVLFFAYNWASTKSTLVWRNFSWQKLSAYCGFAMLLAFVVHYSVNWLNQTVFPQQFEFYDMYKGNLTAQALLVFFTAITPALFEELGFRGYLMDVLLKVADKEQAVYISAFLFAIIHMNLLGLFWLIPIALILGFVRLKENTLWYGIFFHFSFNLTACLFQLL